MTKLVIEGPAEEVGPFWTQFFSRPVGFGFFNTFYPEPPGLNTNKSARWRCRHWGVQHDARIQTMQDNKNAQDIDLNALERAVVVNRIAGLFPKSKFTWSSPGEVNFSGGGRLLDSKLTRSITEIVPLTGLLRKPAHLPDIFDIRWHRCRYCGVQLTKHAKLQCLFSSTTFTPVLPTWRTVFGEYTWQPNFMSFVSTAGSTTTTTSIKARTTDQSPAKPTSAKRKPKRTAKSGTSLP